MHYFSLFSTKFEKPSVNFSRVWTKKTNCWESLKILKFFDKNPLEKLNFYLFLEMLLLKIEPSEITSFFYNNFFNFGGGTFPAFPLPAPLFFDYLLKMFKWSTLKCHS